MSGYYMIDCDGLNLLSESTQTLPGLFAKCALAHKQNKPVYACNLGYGLGKNLTPVNVMVLNEDAQTYVCSASVLQIWVSDDDEVTIVNLAPATND